MNKLLTLLFVVLFLSHAFAGTAILSVNPATGQLNGPVPVPGNNPGFVVPSGYTIEWLAGSTFKLDAGAIISGLAFGTMASQNANAVAITGGTITGMSTPVNPSDVATKAYADSVATGITLRTGVAVASTANLTLSAEQTIDGVLTSASRILVKNQTAPAENGIYVTAAGAWSRASDSDTAAELLAQYVYFVSGGSTQAASSWAIQAPAPVTLGTDAITFAQFTGSTSYTAGTGLLLTGSVFSLRTALSGLTITTSTYNGNTITSGSAILTGAAGKTLAWNNSITLAGTDGTSHTLPSTNSVLARKDAAQTFTGLQTLGNGYTIPQAAGTTGTTNSPTVGQELYFDPFTNGTTTTIPIPSMNDGDFFRLYFQACDGVASITFTGVSVYPEGNPNVALPSGIYVPGPAGNHSALLRRVHGKVMLSDDAWQGTYATETGTTNAYVVALSPSLASYPTGSPGFTFIASTANTAACTLNINSVAAKTIKKVQGGITTDLVANDIRVGQVVNVVYDGTNWQMTSPAGNVSNAVTATALQTARTIAITGDLAYTSPAFDGSVNVTAAGILATVNSNVGTFGSTTAIPSFTVNAKGLITAATTVAVVAPAGTLTGATLASGVTASSLLSFGSGATLNNGVLAGLATFQDSTAERGFKSTSMHITLNVKDYGAVGNGSTDDTAAINAALAAATSGSTVYFPAASPRYNHTGLTFPASLTNVLIKGAQAQLYQTVNANNTLIVPNTCSYVTFDGIWFNGVGSARANGIHLRINADYTTVRNCRIERSSDWGIQVDSAGSAVKGFVCENNLFKDTCGDGVHVMNVDGFQIENNYFDQCGDDAIAALAQSATIQPQNGIISNNLIKGRSTALAGANTHGFRGIVVMIGKNIQISENKIYNTYSVGIGVEDEYASSIYNSEITVNGNTLYGCNQTSGALGSLEMYFCKRSAVKGNHIVNPFSGSGITVADCSSLTIKENDLVQSVNQFCRGIVTNTSTPYTGGRAITACNDITIAHNMFDLTQASSNEAIYMPFTTGIRCNNLIVAGNESRSTAIAYISTDWIITGKFINNITIGGTTAPTTGANSTGITATPNY